MIYSLCIHYFRSQHIQPMASPESKAYVRLWVDDHLLYPLNSTIESWGTGVGPMWIPLPPRPLDGRGREVDYPGAPSLGGYDIRLEYVCVFEQVRSNVFATLKL